MKHNIKAFPHGMKADFLNGMELRDYFAAKVIQGDLSHNGCMNVHETARFAYELADAMMEAREQ